MHRLTIADRRVIAAGLAEGLAHAEIARRLGRPTSTVSREVARNGAGLYSAELAQRAVRRRQRDRAKRTPAAAHGMSPFEDFASLLMAGGMPRMAARVFARLITSPTNDLAVSELMRDLSVGSTSVSKAVRFLLGMELIERHHEAGGRTRKERYSVRDSVWLRLLHADPGVQDALTVVAALGAARHPIGVEDLATGLGWAAYRLAAAIDRLRRYQGLADPFVLDETDAGFALRPRRDRLATDQRVRLSERCAD